MSDQTDSFLQRCLRGEAAPGDIEDYVEEWHRGTSSKELPQYLGMTAQEYSLWIRDPDSLAYIVKSRQDILKSKAS